MALTSPPIGVGIVGLSANGGWAAAAHVPALAAVDGFALRALSASSAESARAAGARYGVPLTFGDAGELARCDAVDLVVVTVKVPGHHALIGPALEAGKAVLSEWPLATGLAQAEELAALTMVLGEFTEVSATTATLRPLVRHATTGRPATMTSEDQLGVIGTLETGTQAALHFRGGTSRATAFHWEINGTDGDLVVDVDGPALWMNRVTLRGAHGTGGALAELPVPGGYELPSLAGRSGEPAYNVAHAYALLLRDLTEGTARVPGFTHAAHVHRLLDRIRHSAQVGRRLATPP